MRCARFVEQAATDEHPLHRFRRDQAVGLTHHVREHFLHERIRGNPQAQRGLAAGGKIEPGMGRRNLLETSRDFRRLDFSDRQLRDDAEKNEPKG